MEQAKKVGLALGSGSARGFSHIGIIRVLQEEGIPIDCVAGTSIGAIIGALYAGGVLSDYEEFLQHLDWKKISVLLDPLLPVSGVISGKRLERLFSSFLQEQNIEDFAVPFAAVAADVVSGEEVILTRGNAVKAIRASMSLPGIFTPVFFQDRFLVDGGLVSPVPVRAARMLGADVVIAVNLTAEMSKRSYISTVKDTANQFQAVENARKAGTSLGTTLLKPKSFEVDMPQFLKETLEKGKNFVGERTQAFEQAWAAWFDEKVERGRAALGEKTSLFSEWLTKKDESAEQPNILGVIFNSIYIMQYEITKSSLRQSPPDALLNPDLAHVRLLDFARAEECIQEGERVARAMLPRIKELIEEQESLM